MTNHCRLDSVAPVAAQRFRHTTLDRRRQAALVGCEQAVVGADLIAPEADEALTVLRGAASASAALRERLERLVVRFDDEYFRLDERGGHEQQAAACFSKARASSALLIALTSDDTQLHEAIYEAISALDDPSELIRLVEQALG